MLGHPRMDRIAIYVALSVVADEVLHVAVSARLLGARHLVATHETTDQRILGEVLEVAAIKRAAVQVDRRSIPAVITQLPNLLAHEATHLMRQPHVPRLSHGHGVRPAHAAPAAKAADNEAAKLRRAIQIARQGFADAGKRRQA